ncbi:MAG TPA: glucose 1-dehydrogenase [Polyangiaceae bacterium]|jgi:glucose 1-dehydrogenase|nr:glucose 1-dehydrogenase [Polyangiaceae bacterium]
MKAITVIPMKAGSVRLDDLAEPRSGHDELLVEGLAMGVCGTDREIARGAYGWAPPERERLVLGHESLGQVIQAPTGSGFTPGELVVGIVRRPDPVPCPHCASREWDMCSNAQYTERGIKSLDGYGAERYVLESSFAVRLDPSLAGVGVLLEPTTIVAKAWEHIDRIGKRALWAPKRALVTGAGPVGLLAALLGVQRGLEVHVFDRATEGPKPALVKALGAEYHVGRLEDAGPPTDVVLECTGVSALVLGAINRLAPGAVMCLTGVSSGARTTNIEFAMVNRRLVLDNAVVFGSVNANERHYQAASEALRRADPAWLAGLITRRVAPTNLREAFERQRDDVKVVVDFHK